MERIVTRDLKEIRRLGLKALSEKLGPVGMAEFLRQFDSGEGDYTKDRHIWLDRLSNEDILKQIEESRNINLLFYV